ncbi:sulfotransferase family 2 domain-containing protein [Mangrovimonas spongiae]|uniref:Sulfotransferase domain-containing protein n=1 Tax=Mangrovimonas spongiae TaxID=2494697 RepID=A0A3R9MF86_9FLAO|nr:sulfotransferase family 2 domain-containing protein [Mangrovimonas spongiae]RSK40703.1 hypothetical protein EJA19_06915 [Mangrovimonas spongiae]
MRLVDKLKRKEKVDKVVIHIGKCGGSSVIEELNKRDLKFFEKHVGEVTYRRNKKYIIVIRNPISRFVSAFNWRYKLVVEDGTQKDLYLGEKELLEKYSDINNLAENIYDEEGNLVLDFKNDEFYIHHLKEDIDFYLADFLKKCKKKQIVAVLATETLSEDLKTHFNITLKSHLKKNKKKTDLSNLAVNNLIQYLEKDYDCIEKLNNMGVLTEKQYQKLSNKVF